MATIDELVIELSADTKELQTQMRTATQMMAKSMADMQKSVEEMSKNGSKNTSFLQNAFSTMSGYIGSEAVLGALNAVKETIIGLFKEGMDGAIEAQNAFTAFSRALINTGNYSQEAANKFRDFADAQQNLTGISAESYLSTGKLLTTMAGLSGPVLENATKSIADLSVVMGTDMDSAARLFSKGVENSTEVFKRFGLQIEDGATRAERTANIIEALNSKFGGASSSAANTYSGALAIMKNSFGEVTEEMGNLLVQNPVLMQTMKSISKIFLELSEFVASNKKEFMELVGNGIIFAIEGFSALIGVMNDVWKVFKVVGQNIAQPFQMMAIGIEAAKAAAEGDFQTAKNILVDGASEIANAWKSTLDDSPLLLKIQDKITDVSAAARVGFADMAAGADVAVGALGKIDNAANKTKVELTAYQEEIKAFSTSLAESLGTQAGLQQLASDDLKSQFETRLLTEQEYILSKQALQISALEQEQAMLDQAIAQKLLTSDQAALAQIALTQKQMLAERQMISEKNAFEKKQREENLVNASSFFGNLANLSKTGNKELGAIAKAAAIAQATIDTYAGATKALAQGGIWAAPMAAAITASGLANVAKIVSTPLATGIDSVPGIGSNDNFPAVLAPQERVVPRETNRDLTEFLASQGSQPRAQINVSVQINDVFTSDPREVGLKIIETINEAAQANGITLLGSNIS